MTSRTLAAALLVTLATMPSLSGTALAQAQAPAQAQAQAQKAPAPAQTQIQAPIQVQPKPQAPQSTVTTVIANYLPVTLWTITGAVIGAVAWPGLAAGSLTITPITTSAALMNPGAAVGAVVGGVGYMASR